MEAVSTSTGPLADVWTRIDAGQFDDAATLLRSLLKQQPSDGHLHALLGVCSAQQGKLDEAVASLETAVLLSPDDPVVECKLAGALLQSGKTEKAMWRLNRVLEADPSNEEAQQLLAHARAAQPTPPSPGPPVPPQAPDLAPVHPSPPGAAARPMPGPPPAAVYQAVPQYAASPGLGLRIGRGLGWGLLYAQTWTLVTMFSVGLISLFVTKVEMAILVFLVMGVLNALFHSSMGMLIGGIAAFMNADEDTGGWIGISVGLLILLIGLFFGFLALWSVFFYIFVGRWIGRSVAARVQKPVGA